MKKTLPKFLASLLIISSLNAGDYTYNVKSLVGFEVGGSKIDVENNHPNPIYTGVKKYNVAQGGIKIGAQSDNYRLFLSGRYFDPKDSYDYILTTGLELQYLFNFSKVANFFLGVNGGYFMTRFTGYTETNTRSVSDVYVGGDAGFNFHINKTIDIEVGGRYTKLNIESNIASSSVTYRFDNIVTGYASVIFKYNID